MTDSVTPDTRIGLLRQFATSAILAGGLVLSAQTLGCASDGTRQTRSRPAARSGMSMTNNAEHDAWAEVGYRISWRGFPILTDGEILHLDVFDEGILVHDSANFMTLLDPRTGANLWTVQPLRAINPGLGNAVYNGQVLACTDVEIFFLDIQTGDLIDRQAIANVVNTAPVLVGDIAVFGSATGQVIGHSLYSGFKAWGYQLSGSIEAAPVAIGDTIGVVSEAGDAILINARNGASSGRASLFGGLRNNPVTDGQSLYVAGVDQSVYAFRGSDCSRMWRYRTESPIDAQPVWAEGVLYVNLSDGGLTAFDAISGDILWQQPGVPGEVLCRRDDLLLVWDGATMTTIEADDGEFVAAVPMPTVTRIVADGFENPVVYATTSDGALLRLNTD